MPSEKKPEPYRMPRVQVGSPVVWRRIPGDTPIAGIVTRVSQSALNVTIFPPDNRGGLPRDGVLHATDPRLPKMLDHDGGCWDFTEDAKQLRAVVESLGLGDD